MKHIFTPDMMVDSLFTIPLTELQKKGIRVLIFDLDNTIVKWNCREVENHIIQWFQDIKEADFQVLILSNNGTDRVLAVAEKLDIPFIARAKKPSSLGAIKAMNMFDVKADECAMIGDQLLTDVFGGNRAGFFTILVTPISPEEFWGTRISRQVEKILFCTMKKP